MAHVSRTNRQSQKPQMILQDAWGENEDSQDLNDREENQQILKEHK